MLPELSKEIMKNLSNPLIHPWFSILSGTLAGLAAPIFICFIFSLAWKEFWVMSGFCLILGFGISFAIVSPIIFKKKPFAQTENYIPQSDD